MNRKRIKNINSNIAFVMIICIVITMLPIGFITVKADVGVRKYSYEDYTVTYSVCNEWENGRQTDISITNTSEEVISNWCIEFEMNGNIDSIWNAEVVLHDDKKFVIKNNIYNQNIQPGQSITFGCVVSGENIQFPEIFRLTQEQQISVHNYEVLYDIVNDWEVGFQGTLRINNNSLEPIESWQLSMSSNVDIITVWGADYKVVDGKIILTAYEWDPVILPGACVEIGFTGVKDTTTVKFTEFELSEIITYPKNSDETESTLSIETEQSTEFQETGSVETESESMSEVMTEVQTEPVSEIMTEAKSESMTEVSTEPESRDYVTDNDNDGIPDACESDYGCETENPDTDGDGLLDGFELLMFGTNPSLIDSDGNGITDSEDDSDGDGLTNLEEYDLGTKPMDMDSDNDGINDNDELNVYGLNPNIDDTDGDGITDGEEIELGLNPNGSYTDGIKDTERCVTQIIGEDETCLKPINRYCDEYQLSMQINSAGKAENNLSVCESNYKDMMTNNAIVGMCVDVQYNSDMLFESMQIQFKISEEEINNQTGVYSDVTDSLQGVNRYNVFEYVEEANMLIPIETYINTEENMVYAQVDSLGTYCVMDLEVWLSELGFSYEEYTEENPESENQMETYLNTAKVSMFSLERSEGEALENESDTIGIYGTDKVSTTDNVVEFSDIYNKMVNGSTENISLFSMSSDYMTLDNSSTIAKSTAILYNSADVVFILQGYGQDEELFNLEKKAILNYGKMAYDLLPNLRIRILFTKLNEQERDTSWIRTYEDLEKWLVSMEYAVTSKYDTDMSRCLDKAMNISYRQDVLPYIIWVMNGAIFYDYNYEYYSPELLIYEDRVAPGMIGSLGYNGNNYQLVYIDVNAAADPESMTAIRSTAIDIAYDALDHLYTRMYDKINNLNYIIAPTGFRRIPEDFGQISIHSKKDYDSDGLRDNKEIDFEKWNLTVGDTDIIKLPSYSDYIDKWSSNSKYLSRFDVTFSNRVAIFMKKLKVLPLISNPLEVDSDMDGLLDNEDPEPMVYNEWVAKSDVANIFKAAGFTYDPKQDIMYSTMNNFQRFFGFSDIIDELAMKPLLSKIDCEPIIFDGDDGMEYRLELWKGSYGMMAGAEVGLYYMPKEFTSFDWEYTKKSAYLSMLSALDIFRVGPNDNNLNTIYMMADRMYNYDQIANTTDEDRIKNKLYKSATDDMLVDMSFDLYEVYTIEEEKVSQLLFSREDNHWWLTGFKLGENFGDTKNAAMDISITFQSESMAESFCNAMNGIGYLEDSAGAGKIGEEDNYYQQNGKNVRVLFNIYKTEQPNNQIENAEFLTDVTDVLANTYKRFYIEKSLISRDPNKITVDMIMEYVDNISDDEIYQMTEGKNLLGTTPKDIRSYLKKAITGYGFLDALLAQPFESFPTFMTQLKYELTIGRWFALDIGEIYKYAAGLYEKPLYAHFDEWYDEFSEEYGNSTYAPLYRHYSGILHNFAFLYTKLTLLSGS